VTNEPRWRHRTARTCRVTTSDPSWSGRDILPEHAIRGFHGVTLLLDKASKTGAVLSSGAILLQANQGFEVYVITDACGDVSEETHERAIERMVQAGARPMTSVQYLLELQRDWARADTYDATTGLAKTFGGAYGLGITYAKTMLGAHAREGAIAA